jgi:hypothetical protein
MLDCYEEISVGPTRCPIFVTRDVREPQKVVAGAGFEPATFGL